ncbi:methionine synthase reductase isoform X2 [Bombina bombina]|nr:methionine synthase reductase isoform X2 [Bombina bombina]XP_053570490.1 methionine synthase reductase isoform X2 [Bombina bombina]
MCGTLKRRLLVLYGTQQGQAKAIAEEIGQQADQHGFIADIYSLKDMSKFDLETERDPVVFVVSTTGTGDPPDNALKFVKKIQNKQLLEDHFASLQYGLLALGDSEYTYFCNGGKIIDKRLQELGAKHFYETGYADDCVGLELVVEPWIDGLWIVLKNKFMDRTENHKMNNCIQNGTKVYQRQPEVPENLDLQIRAINLEPSLSLNGSSLSTNEQLEPSLVCSASPLSESSLNVPALPPDYLEVQILDCDVRDVCPSLLYPGETVFRVPITQAVQLTAADAVKTTLMLELDISNTKIELQPGDSFAIVCPNPSVEVRELLMKLDLADKIDFQVSLKVKSGTKKRGASLPSYIPENSSLRSIFTWCLEIRSVPKKAFIRALVEYTSDSKEKRRLQELCSKQGNCDYNQFIRDRAISIFDLLNAFPSCKPPLNILIEHLPKLQARPYSAASSYLFHPGKLRFVFNVVEFASFTERPIPRKGVCTGWLAELVDKMTYTKHEQLLAVDDKNKGNLLPEIYIFSRLSTSFHLPADTSVPVVMVGPGTGIAPFIGFLQHREKLQEQNPELKFGETWLFFGCRNRDKDYIFRQELSCFLENGTLSHLKVCFSRDSSNSHDVSPKYVQDNLRVFSSEITRMLIKENGHLYVCGDAKNMMKEVNDTLTDIFSAELSVDKLDAMKTLASLRDRKQYLQDVWT